MEISKEVGIRKFPKGGYLIEMVVSDDDGIAEEVAAFSTLEEVIEFLRDLFEPAVEGNIEDHIKHVVPSETPFMKMLKGD